MTDVCGDSGLVERANTIPICVGLLRNAILGAQDSATGQVEHQCSNKLIAVGSSRNIYIYFYDYRLFVPRGHIGDPSTSSQLVHHHVVHAPASSSWRRLRTQIYGECDAVLVWRVLVHNGWWCVVEIIGVVWPTTAKSMAEDKLSVSHRCQFPVSWLEKELRQALFE